MSTERAILERTAELRQDRDGLLAQAKTLLDRAESAERDLDPEERTQWRTWLDQVNAIERELEANLDVRIAAERAAPDARFARWKRGFFRP